MGNFPDGLYDLLITRELEKELSQLGTGRQGDRDELDPADGHLLFARYIAGIIREALRGIPDRDKPERQAEIANEILRAAASRLPKSVGDDDLVAEPPARLAAVYPITGLKARRPQAPAIPLSQSDLLVNARGEPRIGTVLEKEIESADRIDLIVAFIRWSGLRLVAPKLRAFVERGGQLRVITSTYTGSTERRAVEQLKELGAEVKVSYDTEATRLHAKAWMFHRDSGFSTVFIGSSNLSMSAMVDGVEWNIRLTQSDAPTIVEKFAATFESYWADPDYEAYDPARDTKRFDDAVRRASDGDDRSITFVGLDVEPWPYQREMLEDLNVERYRHNRWRNLVVAATGTGKTVVAALDYRRLNDPGEPLPWPPKQRPLSLLFVAHRREILRQSRDTFRVVLRDGSFGELYVDGERPDQWRHVFASIQSLSTIDLDRISPEAFDVVIVDEFHHAAAPTYRKLLDHLRPKVLLGLTATPERTDGEPILDWFGGRIAVELRLWDALDRGLLSPFHYFGVHDNVDLSKIAWQRGRYDERELENVYTANDARVAQVIQQLRDKLDVTTMRALGFCVGVHHARLMADRFQRAGIPAAAVLGTTDSTERDEALRRLRNREINCLFAVDIFNEGVDVPEIDTVMFLRPTESALVFLQQLGRGLRRSKQKNCLTVLDFIGNAHRNFRFDLRYRALTGASRREIEQQVEEGFPYLPAGCSIQLDREASRVVLENLRQSIGSNRFANLVYELRQMPRNTTLSAFLHESALDPEDLYRSKGWSWTRLKREAGHSESSMARIADAPATTQQDDEPKILNAFPRLLHMDDERRLALLRRTFTASAPPPSDALTTFDRRVLEGFLMTVWSDEEQDLDRAMHRLWSAPSAKAELLELIDVLDERASHRTFPLDETLPSFADVPLSLHARYTRDEVLSAIGRSTLAAPFKHREGPLWHEPTNTDYFFITLDKSEKYYSPSTRYRDYAISPDVFHWESQSGTRAATPTGQRYIHHAHRGSNVMLFVRPRNKDGIRTMAFTFLGPATYIEHSGDRPMAILWKMHRPMPLDVFNAAKVAAG